MTTVLIGHGSGEEGEKEGTPSKNALISAIPALAVRLHLSGRGVECMQTTTPLGDALGRYLDLASDQLKLTASNMANIDTPGYKTKGFDFEQEFRRQQSGLDTAGPQVTAVDGLVARPDGNNVSMDREGLQLAQEQLKFKMGVELLKHEFSTVMSAIHAETK